VRTSTRYALFAALGILVVIVAARYITWHHEETADELTELALHGGSPDEQEQAATRLEALAARSPRTGPRNAAEPYLARLFTESDNPGVRAAAMRGFATIWDYDYVPKMLDLLQDPSPLVRYTAAKSLAALIQVAPRFEANDPAEKRAAAAKELRNKWEQFVVKNLKSWQRRLAEKDAKR